MRTYSEHLGAFNQLGYTFRLNAMNDIIECNGERLGDALTAVVVSRMNDAGFTSAAAIQRNLTRAAYENQYHPLRDYLQDAGKKWDGENHFEKFISYFSFEHSAIARVFIWKFLLGAVGKVLDNGQNFMLIFNGVQGLGKSFLARWLVPPPLQKYFVEGGLNPDSKDAKIRIMGNLLWEVGELQGITRHSELEALKNIITQQRITTRIPYAKYDIDKPAVCSFVGTVNENGSGFLNDVTGNRRFAIVTLERVDWDYTQLDPEQIWAQVVAAYWAGERGTLTAAERAEQNTINEEFSTMSLVEQYFWASYEINYGAEDDWIPVSTILDVLEMNGLSKTKQKLNLMDLANLLQKHGCKRSRRNRTTGYGRQTCYNCVARKTPKPIGTGSVWNP
jgi:predicted P-loop ATPase